MSERLSDERLDEIIDNGGDEVWMWECLVMAEEICERRAAEAKDAGLPRQLEAEIEGK